MKKLQTLVVFMLSVATFTEQIFSSTTPTVPTTSSTSTPPTPPTLSSSQEKAAKENIAKKAVKKDANVKTEKEIWNKLKEDKKEREKIEAQLEQMIKKAKKEDKAKVEKTLLKVKALEKTSGKSTKTASTKQ